MHITLIFSNAAPAAALLVVTSAEMSASAASIIMCAMISISVC